MRVLCIFSEGQDLSTKILEAIPYGDKIFFLKINEQYGVYGMTIWAGVLHYLVVDVWGRPSWFPAELFAVIDDLIPDNFHFKFYRKYDISAVWGYKELLDEQHYDRLIERQEKDLAIFFNNKKILDKQNTDNLSNATDPNTKTIGDILQNYYDGKTTTPEFIATFNHCYDTFFSKDLNKKYQAMFDALYAVTQPYNSTPEQDGQLKKNMQKLYFSINFPDIQFKHQ